MRIFIFLRSLPETAIPRLWLPYSYIATLASMSGLCYMLADLSMIALIFDGMLDIYYHCLQWVLWHRAANLAFSVLMLAATAVMFMRIAKGFVPDSDNDQLLIQIFFFKQKTAYEI